MHPWRYGYDGPNLGVPAWGGSSVAPGVRMDSSGAPNQCGVNGVMNGWSPGMCPNMSMTLGALGKF